MKNYEELRKQIESIDTTEMALEAYRATKEKTIEEKANETLSHFKKTDCGRYGKTFEIMVKQYLNGNKGNSNKVSLKGKHDVKHKGKIFEIKSNCGEINDNIMSNDYIIYTMDNKTDYAYPDCAYVFTPSDFVKMFEELGLLRDKKTTNGQKVKAIQTYSNSKKKTQALRKAIEYYALNYVSAFK